MYQKLPSSNSSKYYLLFSPSHLLIKKSLSPKSRRQYGTLRLKAHENWICSKKRIEARMWVLVLLVIKVLCNLGPISLVIKSHLVSSPDGYGSVGWASSCKAKCHWFDSWLGHMPGLQPSLQLGSCVRGKPIDVSLLLFLPPFPFL